MEGKLADALEQLDAALPVSRDLGDARLESIVLCNLAMAERDAETQPIPHSAQQRIAGIQASARVVLAGLQAPKRRPSASNVITCCAM